MFVTSRGTKTLIKQLNNCLHRETRSIVEHVAYVHVTKRVVNVKIVIYRRDNRR